MEFIQRVVYGLGFRPSHTSPFYHFGKHMYYTAFDTQKQARKEREKEGKTDGNQ